MEGGRGLAAAGAAIICVAITILVILSLIFLITYYVRPKGWKIITASSLNLVGIVGYFFCELHKEVYISYQQTLLHILLTVFVLIIFVWARGDSR